MGTDRRSYPHFFSALWPALLRRTFRESDPRGGAGLPGFLSMPGLRLDHPVHINERANNEPEVSGTIPRRNAAMFGDEEELEEDLAAELRVSDRVAEEEEALEHARRSRDALVYQT